MLPQIYSNTVHTQVHSKTVCLSVSKTFIKWNHRYPFLQGSYLLEYDNCLLRGTTQPIVPCPPLLYHSKKMLRSPKHIDYAHLFSLGLGKLSSGVTKVRKEEMPGIAWATCKDKRQQLTSTRVEALYGVRQLRQLFTCWCFSGLLHWEPLGNQRREKTLAGLLVGGVSNMPMWLSLEEEDTVSTYKTAWEGKGTVLSITISARCLKDSKKGVWDKTIDFEATAVLLEIGATCIIRNSILGK